MAPEHLFVYGILPAGAGTPQAARLARKAVWLGDDVSRQATQRNILQPGPGEPGGQQRQAQHDEYLLDHHRGIIRADRN